MAVALNEPEDILFPDLPIVDSHIHLWDRTGFDYFAAEYLKDVADGHKVESSVYVECNMHYSDDPRPAFQAVGETRFMLDQARLADGSGHALNAGNLFAADLMLGDDVAPVLDAQIEASEGRASGVRFRVAYDDDPVAGYHEVGYLSGDVLDDPVFESAAHQLAKRGLVLDLWAFHTQLERVRKFAERIPELTIVLDHVGGPLGVGRYEGHRDEVFADWSRGIGILAQAPNVLVKLSGLGISRMGCDFNGGQVRHSDELVTAWAPYILRCVEAFGANRSIFGSNFPVDRRVASYRQLLNAYKKMLAQYSSAERQAIFADNARRTYRLIE